jgi:hypothetical protein
MKGRGWSLDDLIKVFNASGPSSDVPVSEILRVMSILLGTQVLDAAQSSDICSYFGFTPTTSHHHHHHHPNSSSETPPSKTAKGPLSSVEALRQAFEAADAPHSDGNDLKVSIPLMNLKELLQQRLSGIVALDTEFPQPSSTRFEPELHTYQQQIIPSTPADQLAHNQWIAKPASSSEGEGPAGGSLYDRRGSRMSQAFAAESKEVNARRHIRYACMLHDIV